VTSPRGEVQWCPSILVDSSEAGAAVEQTFDGLYIPISRSLVQRRFASLVRRADLSTMGEEQVDQRETVARRGFV